MSRLTLTYIIAKSFTNVRADIGSFWLIWGHLGLFSVIWVELGPFKVIWAQLESFGLSWVPASLLKIFFHLNHIWVMLALM